MGNFWAGFGQKFSEEYGRASERKRKEEEI